MNKGLKIALIAGGTILALLLVVPPVIGMFTGWRGGYGMMGLGRGEFGFMGLMGIFWVVVIGLVIWAIAAAGHRSGWSGNYTSTGQSESALEILKKRYARGEINKAEYEEKKKDLV